MLDIAPPKAIMYAGLPAALRRRKDQFNVSHVTLDFVSGLASGYTAKLFCVPPIRTLGATSFSILLRTMALRLILVDARRKHHADDLFFAEVGDFSELQTALRRRREQLQLPFEKFDGVNGLTARIAARLLSPSPTTKLSRRHVDPLLHKLHLRLLPLDDHAAIARMSHRLIPRRWRHGVRRQSVLKKNTNSLPDVWQAA